MSISCALKQMMSMLNTLTGAYIDSGDNTYTVDGLDRDVTLNASSTPGVSKGAVFAKALSGGAGTIDLTALPGQSADETVDGTGLTVVACMFRGKSTNVDPITVTFGAANPYNLLGATFTFDVEPGQQVGPIYLADLAPTIGAGAKNIDISGTGAEILECAFLLSD